jgi:DNA-binding response OmpR family regulator
MKGLNATQKAEADRRRRAPAHILLVDDDTRERELLALHLTGAGYRVTCAEDAVAAGHRMVEQVPDLIIADFRMPYMNGVDFVAALRGDATIPDLPVIFLTSLATRDQIAGRTFGFPLLTKPLDGPELLATVAAELRRGAP